MTYIKRLHLRENWPLWVAITLFCLVLLCLCAHLLYPIGYPYDNSIAYSLVILYQTIILPLTCLTLVAFIPITLIATVNTTGRTFLYFVLLAIASSIVLCRLSSS